MNVKIKTITTDEPDMDEIELTLIKKVEELAELVQLTEEEKEDAEHDKEVIEEIKFDKLYDTLPTIEVPKGAYIEDDYRPWTVFYQLQDGDYSYQVRYLEIA